MSVSLISGILLWAFVCLFLSNFLLWMGGSLIMCLLALPGYLVEEYLEYRRINGPVDDTTERVSFDKVPIVQCGQNPVPNLQEDREEATRDGTH